MSRLGERDVSLWLLLGIGAFVTSAAVYWWATDSNAPGLASVFMGLLPLYAILVAYGIVFVSLSSAGRARFTKYGRNLARSTVTGTALTLGGTALAVWGALSFEHELSGTVASPIVMVMYPLWVKVTVVIGVVVAVAGVFVFTASRNRRSNSRADRLNI